MGKILILNTQKVKLKITIFGGFYRNLSHQRWEHAKFYPQGARIEFLCVVLPLEEHAQNFYACSLGTPHKIHITQMLYRMLFLLTNVRKVWVFLGISLGKVIGIEWQAKGLPPEGWGGRPSACPSILTTFPRVIPRKTLTFLTLVNKNNILFSIRVI